MGLGFSDCGGEGLVDEEGMITIGYRFVPTCMALCCNANDAFEQGVVV